MARTRLGWVVVLCVVGGLLPRAAAGQVAFHGVGDLPGGPTLSVVFDATKSGGLIRAVGASAANPQTICSSPGVPAGCVAQFNTDTPILWTFDGATGILTALPNLVPNVIAPNTISAYAISRDGAYIASDARFSVATPGQFSAVRVAVNGLTNLNLTVAPFTVLPPSNQATSISADGSILYGISGNPNRAYRFNTLTSTTTQIPLPSGSADTGNAPTIRGVSADGSVLVGVSFQGVFTFTNGHAYRYVHSEPVGTVTVIPMLPGGTWNDAVAVSADGNLTVVAGNSTDYPNGEVYLHNATTGEITRLGSPNTPWTPASFAGVTSDGSVVAITFAGDASLGRHAYFHNAHGWFNLASALGAQGVDITLDGWDVEGSGAAGISPDGTLVFGAGLHNGNREGYVAEFPAGYLASFDIPAIPPTDTTIVSYWGASDVTGGLVFMADGTYYHMDASHGSAPAGENTSGFERGRYRYDGTTGALAFDTLFDTNGDVGLSGANGILGIHIVISNDTIFTNGEVFSTRLVGAPGSVVGAWVVGDPRVAHNSAVLTLTNDGHYFFADDSAHHHGLEYGTYVIGAGGTITFTSIINTNSEGGGITSGPGQSFGFGLLLSRDELHMTLTEPGGATEFTRVVDPKTVLPSITSALTAGGVADQPFTYTITATHADSFGATGLPAGLTIDTSTGVISGSPNAAGTYPILISATNSFGGVGTATLTLTVAPSKVRLTPSTVFTRNQAGDYVATITLTNDGNTPATDAAITDVALNKTTGTPGPMALPVVAPGDSVIVVETFPASAASGKSGKDSFRLQLKWSRGSTTTNDKVTLP